MFGTARINMSLIGKTYAVKFDFDSRANDKCGHGSGWVGSLAQSSPEVTSDR